MSKQYKIKWRIQDERELAQVARDFNRKLGRLIDVNPKNKSVLPQFYNPVTQQLESEITVATLKELITTRADYNRYVRMLKRFMREGAEDIIDAPGNEYDAKTTKWHVDEMRRLAMLANKRKKSRLEDLQDVEMSLAEGGLGYTLGERFGMGLASKAQLKPTKPFTPSQSSMDINFKLSSLMKQTKSSYYAERDALLKANFIRELERNYARSDVAEVIEAVKGMDNDLFVMKFEAHGDGMEQVYPPERGTPEYEANVQELKDYWTTPTNMIDLSPAMVAALLNL